MNEQDILNLIKGDEWMMGILRKAEELNLANWLIGAGFVRNKVWNYLHGYSKEKVDTHDIDFIYFDSSMDDKSLDDEIAKRMEKETGMPWEIVNEKYTYKWKDRPMHKSVEDALSGWPETVTCIGVRLNNGELILITPYGISDLVNLKIRKSPNFNGSLEKIKERVEKKRWLEKWPKLRFEE